MVARRAQSFYILEGAAELLIELWPKFFCQFNPDIAFSPKRRPTIAKIFQLNNNKFGTNRDIGFRFSAFVHHMPGLNLLKNFGHNSIKCSVARSSM